MISQILFEIPALYEMGVKTGDLLQIGGLLKDAASGQIVAHLQESGLAHSLIGNAMLGMASPATLGLSAVSQLVNAGTGVYTAVQVNQLKTMVEGLQSLQIATLGVSLLGVGVSVAGFLYMRKRFNAVDERIEKLLDSVIEGFETQQKANLRAHLSQVKGLVQQAIQAHTLTNPQREYSRIAECLAGEAAHFEGELELVVKIHGKVNHELFWQLAQALMVCNSARVDCRIRTNELRNALTVSLGVAESYEGLFGHLPVSVFAETKGDVICAYAPSQSKAVIAVAGSAGGAGVATAAIGQALGLSVVTHSSGAFILSGSGGYIAGTLGAAVTAPAIIAVAVVVGGTAATVELVCAPRNHPGYVAKVEAAAVEARRRWDEKISVAMGSTNETIERISAQFEDVTDNVFEYIYR